MTESSFIPHTLKSTVKIDKFVTVLSYELSKTFKTRGERHNFWEMVYVERGSVFYRRNEEAFQAEAGELIFHRPGEFHSIRCDGSRGASVFIITFYCKSAVMKFFHERSFMLTPKLTSVIKRLINECNGAFAVSNYPMRSAPDAPIGGEQLARMYLEELLILLMRTHEQDTHQVELFIENDLCDKIRRYLKEHLTERITLDGLSAQLHFGKSRLCEIFKKSTGQTIIQYYNKLKIDESKRLLREGKMTVGEIAASLGFSNPEYFSRLFHRTVGVSPGRYKSTPVSDGSIYLEEELELRAKDEQRFAEPLA